MSELSSHNLGIQLKEQKAKLQKNSTKMSSKLTEAYAHLQAQRASLQSAGATKPDYSGMSTPFVHINTRGDLQVYIHVKSWGEKAKNELIAHGVTLEVVNTRLGIAQGWVPVDQLKAVETLDFVKSISEPSYGDPSVGSVTTEGDVILNADAVRALGYDGAGVRVGVISGGVLGLSSAQQSGDLSSVTVLKGDPNNAEGTAMLEIVHDLAPGATLGFCGLPSGTTLEFISCVHDLRVSFGADIIVDDVGFFQEPYFQDGRVAQEVSDAVSAGILYASSAGNYAKNHYQGSFVNSPSVLDFHDFGLATGVSSDPFMDISIPPGATVRFYLQWSEPFGGASSDYDFGLLDDFGNPLEGSADPQDGNDNPFEYFSHTNFSLYTWETVHLAILKYSGANRVLELFIPDLQPDEYIVPEGSIFGHKAVPGVLAVAAINADDPGVDTIAPYSSRGPSDIFFPSRQVREKPDITAVDNVSVTGAGGFGTPFPGTSAAAPHVAGVAALLMSAVTAASDTQIKTAIKNSAVDLGSPGFDRVYGAGRIDALAALQRLDQDGDGIPNGSDNCPSVSNPNQADSDSDGAGNACDADDDNDGVPDTQDAFPFDPNESVDTDHDGIGNNADTDDDNDGLSDIDEINIYGTNPLNPDTDGDTVDDGFEVEEGLDPTDGSDCPDWLCRLEGRGWRLALLRVAATITTDPVSQAVSEGQTATFSVVATGSAPLSYQWRRGGAAIPGATTDSYTTPATVLADDGAVFDVVVTNAVGSVTSGAATLTVN